MSNLYENKVLSEVHALQPACPAQVEIANLNLSDLKESRFVFRTLCNGPKGRTPDDQEVSTASVGEHATASGEQLFDEDGDPIIHRRTSKEQTFEHQTITIVHAMATDLSHVGQQVWLGALLLCDFLLHYRPLQEDCVVLDLGAGSGLTSIVAALSPVSVLCTDHGDDVLNLARVNVERNSHLLKGEVKVRHLDWFQHSPQGLDQGQESAYSFTKQDQDLLDKCSVILAAEVVYDTDLTDALFGLLYQLLVKKPAKVVYLSVEQRQIFTLAARRVCSPAYEHFRDNLRDLCSVDQGPVRFLCSQVDSSFPQYFQYQRSKHLELWKIEAIFPR